MSNRGTVGSAGNREEGETEGADSGSKRRGPVRREERQTDLATTEENEGEVDGGGSVACNGDLERESRSS